MRRGRFGRLFGGGTDGNEQLTAIAGVILLVLFAVLGITIVRIGQLLWLHLFLGVLLVGPVALKLASTGYRFARYYTANPAYRRKGPPHPLMRMLGPLVILSTVAVFLTGLLLLIDGPAAPSILRLLHKLSFFAWLAVVGVHVLGHLVGAASALRAVSRAERRTPQPPGLARAWPRGARCVGRRPRARAAVPARHPQLDRGRIPRPPSHSASTRAGESTDDANARADQP